MAVTNFIPEIWSADLLVALEKAHVYAGPGVVNRDYEGEISSAGDTVRITSVNEPSVGTYAAHTDITVEALTDTQKTLVIDQSKYFAFELDDVERRQALNGGALMTEQARKAAYKLRDIVDIYVAGLMAAGVDAGNLVAEQTIAGSVLYDQLVDLSVMLDEDNVPEGDRWAVITPAMHGALLKDQRFISAGDEAGAQARANGRVGEAAGFSIRKSNNVPDGPGVGAGKLLIAGYGGATTFAEQINKVEATRKEKGFADIVKGLHLYGSKVVRPTGLVAADLILS